MPMAFHGDTNGAHEPIRWLQNHDQVRGLHAEVQIGHDRWLLATDEVVAHRRSHIGMAIQDVAHVGSKLFESRIVEDEVHGVTRSRKRPPRGCRAGALHKS